MRHSEENRRDELKNKKLILSKNKQKEGDADDIVDTDTDTDTDMSENNSIDQANDILDEEKDLIYKNDIVWVKTKK